MTFQFPEDGEQGHAIFFRATYGSAAQPVNGYQVRIGKGGLEVGAIVQTARSNISGIFREWGADRWHLRLRAVGPTIMVKTWRDEEPKKWDVQLVDRRFTHGVFMIPSGLRAGDLVFAPL